MAGSGSMQRRGENSWLLTVSDGVDGKGERIRRTRTVTANSPREAKKLLAKFVVEVDSGLFADSENLTFEGFVKLWLKNYAEKQLAPKTVARYKAMLDSRILPVLGRLKMEKIRPGHLIEFFNELENSPRLDGKLDQDGKPAKLSDQTLKHHYRCISAVLQDGVEWQIIAHNPAARVKPPKTERKQITCYDEEQTAILLKAIANEPLKCRVLVFLEIVTGLRGGEMMGLEWKHVDFENNTITVKQASQYLPGMGIFTKDPKNKGSERTIAIPSEITALLKEYRKEQLERQLRIGSQWKGSDRLFTTWDGRPGYPGWPGKWLHSFIEKKNLPHTTFHGLRHLNATLLIKAGIPLKNISTRLGHTTMATTSDIYGHSLKSVDRQAAETMGDIIGSKLATIK